MKREYFTVSSQTRITLDGSNNDAFIEYCGGVAALLIERITHGEVLSESEAPWLDQFRKEGQSDLDVCRELKRNYDVLQVRKRLKP